MSRDDEVAKPINSPAPSKPNRPKPIRPSTWKRTKLRVQRFFGRYVFTSLTQRIIFLNLAALIVLLSGILFLNQFRDSLIEAREESLLAQGEIIGAAISARATVETDAITIDPELLIELQTGESTYPMESENENLDFPNQSRRCCTNFAAVDLSNTYESQKFMTVTD